MDLETILRQLMNEGGVRIEITITPLEDKATKGRHFAVCSHCKKRFGPYTRTTSAARALRTHEQHCAARNYIPDWLSSTE